MNDYTYVGKNIVREDAYDKVRGTTQYICDRKEVDMLYGKLVLSKKAHSNISISKEEALKVDGVVAVYTYEDIPKVRYNPHNWYGGVDSPEDQYIFSEKARYVGDHLALVVGSSKEAVEEGTRKVIVTYECLPTVIGLEEAKKEDKNLAFSKEIKYGEYSENKMAADYIVTTTASTQKIHHGALENHIALAKIDEVGNLVLWSPCQTVYQVRYHICHLLNLPYAKVRVIKAVMGGSFGGKGQTVLEPACAFACHQLKKPVMVYMDRTDTIIATRSRNAAQMTIETAVTKDGIIVGRKMNCDIDGGAYYTNASAVAMALVKKLNRMYRMNSQLIQVNTYFTNTIPGGACRGYGSPQGHAMTEINLEKVARVLNINPCDLRLRNLVKPFDEDPTGGTNLGNAQIAKCVETGRKEFDWDTKYYNIRNKNTKRYAYGVGMACGAHGNGYMGAYPDFTNVDMELQWDGKVDIKIGIHDQGCGTILTMQQIAAEALSLDTKEIIIHEADTFITPYDSAGTQASRVTYVCGRAVFEAAEKLKKKILKACKKVYGWKKEEINLKDGTAYYKQEKKTFGEIVLDYEKKFAKGMRVTYEYQAKANPGTYACGFAEVKVDKYTGLVTVEDYVAVHDIGQAINHMLAEGQVSGGAQMSIGMALFEEIEVDATGDVKSLNFSKYHMINAPDMPMIRSFFIEEQEEHGPYGAKSLGEMAAVCPAPAVVNAINYALNSDFSNYPVKPEHIIAFLEGE